MWRIPIMTQKCPVIVRNELDYSHCIEFVTPPTSMVRLEVMTVGITALMYSLFILLECKPPNRTGPLWLSRPCRSRCDLACFWLQQAFVLPHLLFQLTIPCSACLGSLAADSRSRAWAQLGVFPNCLLAWGLWDRTHAGLTVVLGPSMTCLFFFHSIMKWILAILLRIEIRSELPELMSCLHG